MDSKTPTPNQMPSLGSRYQLQSQVGSGGMSTVYRAFDKDLEKVVAIKVLSMDLTSEAAVRFHTEAKATAKLDHPNIVKVLHFGQTDEGSLYLIMDFIEGPTLEQYIKKHGPLSVELALPVLSEICAGLKHAHRHTILHRDVKPSNVILSPKADGYYQVKLLDFGLARLESEDQRLTAAGVRMGSPPYMSPEQAKGEPVDYRSDLYSMGCLMFKVLTGKPPFVGDTYMETIVLQAEAPPPLLNDNNAGLVFPEALEQIVSKLLEKDPSRRFQSFEELQTALDELQLHLKPSSNPSKRSLVIDIGYATTAPHTPASKSLHQHWKFFVLAAILLVVPATFIFMQLKNYGTKGPVASVSTLESSRLPEEPTKQQSNNLSEIGRNSFDNGDGGRQGDGNNRSAKYGERYYQRYREEGTRSVAESLWSDRSKRHYLRPLAELWKEPEFAENMNDPAVKQFLMTPDVWSRWNENTARRYAKQKHIQQLMKNPRFLALTKDPQFQQLMRDAQFRNYVTEQKSWKDAKEWYRHRSRQRNRGDRNNGDDRNGQEEHHGQEERHRHDIDNSSEDYSNLMEVDKHSQPE